MQESNKTKNNTIIYLVVIIVIATLLRLLFLETIPGGFSCDEAANGYEAYSILETMRDRYGKFMPLFLKVLGNDYRESLYIFITVPFIKIFGLNEFGTRFPAALCGILTVVAVYYFVKECFNNRVALISALLLAINPWHIQFNRIAFRVNLLPLLLVLGLLFFAKSFKNPKYLPLTGLMFGLSLWTYSSARAFISLFVLGLTIIFYKHLWRNRVQTLIAFILFIAIFLPLFKFWISPQGMTRARQTGVAINLETIQNYLSYFSPKFLFFSGENDKNLNLAKFGCLYAFELVTVTVGIFFIARENRKERAILLLWLIFYPIPAALAGPASALRSFVGAPLFAILSAYGATQLIDRFRFQERKIFKFTAFLILATFLAIFSNRYFINYPLEAAQYWQKGMREAITYAEKSSCNCVILSSDRNSNCFAIQDFITKVPFYIKYPPEEYQLSPIPPWIRGSREKVYSLE